MRNVALWLVSGSVFVSCVLGDDIDTDTVGYTHNYTVDDGLILRWRIDLADPKGERIHIALDEPGGTGWVAIGAQLRAKVPIDDSYSISFFFSSSPAILDNTDVRRLASLLPRHLHAGRSRVPAVRLATLVHARAWSCYSRC